ncbi:sodium-dependent transporter [Stenotrophomonas sp. MMGLT7]|uniref:sodium-dependent transporter n=1 Tax=Stenotrophomonas sp. MMGLT7 TaxID=2901227 RepID=UPI001E501A4F|nr:sodium-dependent transporter [Stenotrophomonas sp. MMGLT7]MCD7098795.1 sodium-dependent transporter [Stenotrophomonas sp. MMGLT7]
MSTATAPRTWSSNLLFLIAAIGTEAGIANVWKFSYLAGVNGGGLFVALYFIALLVLAIPALMAEMLLGRLGGRSVMGNMQVLVDRYGIARAWKGFGWLALTCIFLILSFYFVVCGWMLYYFVLSVTRGFAGMTAESAAQVQATMMGNPVAMLACSGFFVAVTALVLGFGVNKGIERVAGVLTPLRFLILIGLLVFALAFADAGAAARFLFVPDFSQISWQVVIAAVGQAFFSLGIGVGVMMTMGAYMKPEYSIAKAVLTVAFAQGLVALLAGMSIFPLVFHFQLEPAQGPGLIFVTLPVAFAQMPGGAVFGALLFMLLSFAALTATIVMQESIVAWLEERSRLGRRALVWLSGLAIWLAGFVTVFSFNRWKDVHPLTWIGIDSRRTPFDLIDYLASNIMMPLGGLMVALIAGWALSGETVARELRMGNARLFKLWRFAVRYVVPAGVLVVFVSIQG